MSKMLSVLFVSFFALPCLAGDADSMLRFKDAGFSIAPLEGKAGKRTYQAIMMFLPAADGFAPNVNVQIQPFEGTIEDYAKTSREQFQAANYKVLKEKLTPMTATWEFSGASRVTKGRELHWYSKAELAGGKAFLVTATSLDSSWDALAPKLKACVDSFKVDTNTAGARP